MAIVYIFVALLVLAFMITVHELGHYIAAKILKFRVNEFAIGMGKAVFKHRSKKTGEIFSLRLIPLGGFCAFEGEDEAGTPGMERQEKKEGEIEPKGIAFNKAHPFKRMIVLFAGGFANIICAVIFSFIMLMVFGYYNTVKINVDPAMTHNDIRTGDIVQEVNGNRFTFLDRFHTQIGKFTNIGDSYELTILRDGEIITIPVTVKEVYSPNGNYYGIGILGAGTEEIWTDMSVGDAIGKSFIFTAELAWFLLEFLGKLIIGQESIKNIGGPFTTVSVMSESIGLSWLNILILIPLISVNLGLFNLLPVPSLDGARMVFVGIEWARRGRPVNPELESKIHMWGLLILFGMVIFLDVNYLFFSRFLLYNSLLC